MTERETPPSVTLKVYKQVKLTNETKKNGMVYPLFVDSTTGWKIGKWYNAGIGDYEIEIDDETNEPTGKIKVKSKLGGFSFRPGLHFGINIICSIIVHRSKVVILSQMRGINIATQR